MASYPWRGKFRLRYLRRFWLYLVFLGVLILVRWTKGIGISDAYYFISRPFWPVASQKQWVKNATSNENLIRIKLLEEDNKRLREILSIKNNSSKKNFISAAVISRSSSGWWQKLEINKGRLNGINVGDSVVGPGGLLGIVQSITPLTSRVRLLTAPGSKVGVWNVRTKQHGLLIGSGMSRPYLVFFTKNIKAKLGDVLSTSPASTLLPPNIPVGVIQSIDKEELPSPKAMVQLLAPPEAIDWVQVRIR